MCELEALAGLGHTNVLRGAASGSRGRLQHARQDLVGARVALEAAVAAWSAADVPYEGARDRLALAAVLLALGNRAGARSEAQEAHRVLKDLGAGPEAGHAETFIADIQRSTQETVATMLFVDIVDSTPLIEAIGDAAWRDLSAWVDATLRRAFAEHHGHEVDHAGDGFFVVFPTARDAVDSAMTAQRRLSTHRKEQGYAPRIRIGIHTGDVIESDSGLRGAAVHRAARICALASADEIIASRTVLEAAGLATTTVHAVALKGVREEVEVGAIAWSPVEIGASSGIGQDVH